MRLLSLCRIGGLWTASSLARAFKRQQPELEEYEELCSSCGALVLGRGEDINHYDEAVLTRAGHRAILGKALDESLGLLVVRQGVEGKIMRRVNCYTTTTSTQLPLQLLLLL